jgi:lysophospholipase L1-like esterase
MVRGLLASSLLLSSALAAPTINKKATNADQVRWFGRVNPATKELTWPGTGVSFDFQGTTASVAIASAYGDNSFDLIVDGGAPTEISKFSGTISTPKLSNAKHTVELRRRSETALGTVTLGNITADGKLSPTIAPKRQIELIGDSITVGYGLDGVLPCVNNAIVTNNPKTYGVLAAKALNADFHVVAWSGKGLIRNYVSPPSNPDTSPILPQLWTRYGANDADGSYTFPTSWNPSAVVINLGTNDFGFLLNDATGQQYEARKPIVGADFTAAMVKFVKQIQVHYPKADFFLVGSPMLSDGYPAQDPAQKTKHTNAIQAAIKQLNSAKMHYVDWPSQGSAVGCDYHPNAATHAAEGKVLAQAIGAALKW